MRVILIITSICLQLSQAYTEKRIEIEPVLVNFTISNAGFNVHGTMNGLEGYILLDNQTSVLTHIEGSIDPNSINTGIGLRDKHLKKADYFNTEKFPKIFMTSTQIRKTGNNKYVGDFDLTLKDIKKTVTVPFTFSETYNVYLLKGEFLINRLDFKLGKESIILSNIVKINIEFKTVTK